MSEYTTVSLPPGVLGRFAALQPYGMRSTQSDRLAVLLDRWDATRVGDRPQDAPLTEDQQRKQLSLATSLMRRLDAVGHPSIKRWQRIAMLLDLHDRSPAPAPTEQDILRAAIRQAAVAYDRFTDKTCAERDRAQAILADPARRVSAEDAHVIVSDLRYRIV